jgi:predicted DNA repair protein MutK
MPGSLLLLLDDVASVLDDVATMTKVAAAKTAGVVGDDLAVNAQQVAGVRADRELPVIAAVAAGSARTKLLLVPAALAVSMLAPWAIPPLLVAGGVFLCYEGIEKLLHAVSGHAARPGTAAGHGDAPGHDGSAAVACPAEERARIGGAIRTDFILSAEIMVIALGVVAGRSLAVQVLVLAAIAAGMTVGVYGLVAAIIKLDDLAALLVRGQGTGWGTGLRRACGRLLLAAAPVLMRLLSIIGTVAMFLVGGGIVTHAIPWLHGLVADHGGHGVTEQATDAAWWWQAAAARLLDLAVGVAVGLTAAAAHAGWRRLAAGSAGPDSGSAGSDSGHP